MQEKDSLRGDGIEVRAQMVKWTPKKGRVLFLNRRSRKLLSCLQREVRLKLLSQYVYAAHTWPKHYHAAQKVFTPIIHMSPRQHVMDENYLLPRLFYMYLFRKSIIIVATLASEVMLHFVSHYF